MGEQKKPIVKNDIAINMFSSNLIEVGYLLGSSKSLDNDNG
jgi:hypothetical protein